MREKIRTNIYLDKVVLKEAQELGLNVSKNCENALKIAIDRLKPIYLQNISENVPINSVNNQVVYGNVRCWGYLLVTSTLRKG